MVDNAPSPSDVSISTQTMPVSRSVYTGPSIVILGAGGCGINIARTVAHQLAADAAEINGDQLVPVKYFDTSMANIRAGERVTIITGGHGSGGVRATNAAAIQKEIAALDTDQLPVADVAIVVASLSGGSGSVCGPVLAREYAKRGSRVVMVTVADSQAELFARNTMNTLKTLTAIAENNEMYLPIMQYDNDTLSRSAVDQIMCKDICTLVHMLYDEATEVDRNDRLNFLDGKKTFGARPGLRLLKVYRGKYNEETSQPLFSYDATEQYDAVLNVGAPDLVSPAPQYTRFRKDGAFVKNTIPTMGLISSNLDPLNSQLDRIEKVLHVTKTQEKPVIVSRLTPSGDSDLIL